MSVIRLGVYGLGTVGTGVVKLLKENQEIIQARHNIEFKVANVCVNDTTKARDCDLTDIKVTDDLDEIVNLEDIDIVIEAIGNPEVARDIALKAVKNKKPVVTANKAMIALYGSQVFAGAEVYNMPVLYEAAVAGGIPIIKAIREGLAANKISSIKGIINGTCNYILSKMATEGGQFDEVLKNAQDLGYAEAEPSLDIDGIDAAHKITILAANAFGGELNFDKVHIEGITKIEPYDFVACRNLNYVIKHLGVADFIGEDKISMRVHPVLIRPDKLLANISEVMNAVVVDTNMVGETVFSGAGAGPGATASAIVADLIEISNFSKNNYLGFHTKQEICYGDISEISCNNYLRMNTTDKAGMLMKITDILAKYEISIESMLQNQAESNDGVVPIVIITNFCNDKKIATAIKELENQDFIHGDIIRIRVDV